MNLYFEWMSLLRALYPAKRHCKCKTKTRNKTNKNDRCEEFLTKIVDAEKMSGNSPMRDSGMWAENS